jgi:hypothetical protein
MIPPESIIVFWNTVMLLLAALSVLAPIVLATLYIIDKKIVKPEYEKMERKE